MKRFNYYMDNNKDDWYKQSIWYHIYPLGLCGAPRYNKNEVIERRMEVLYGNEWLNHLKDLHIGGVYIGPLFKSSTHGYDTINFYEIDQRLGDSDTFKTLVSKYHSIGIRVIVDAVFNHVSRDFFAFADLRCNGKNSKYCNWFKGVDFNKQSPYGDNFDYSAWGGYYELPELCHENENVKKYLFEVVKYWHDEFCIDGIRLDAADCISIGFWNLFRDYCKSSFGEGFAILGEIIHGDYTTWVNCSPSKSKTSSKTGPFDGITNYALWKALWSSHNDLNLFELVHTLQREDNLFKFGWLYNFLDNHDVTRIASQLSRQAYLGTIFILLYTLPGSPSIYYGSEFGWQGMKGHGRQADFPLRPALSYEELTTIRSSKLCGLLELVRFLSTLRDDEMLGPALQRGEYEFISNTQKQFAFKRKVDMTEVLIVINIDSLPIEDLKIKWKGPNGYWRDILHPTNSYKSVEGDINISLQPFWGCIIPTILPNLCYRRLKSYTQENYVRYIPTILPFNESNGSPVVKELEPYWVEEVNTPPLLSPSLTLINQRVQSDIEIQEQTKENECEQHKYIEQEKSVMRWFKNTSIYYIPVKRIGTDYNIIDTFTTYICSLKFPTIALGYIESSEEEIYKSVIEQFVNQIKSKSNGTIKLLIYSEIEFSYSNFDGIILSKHDEIASKWELLSGKAIISCSPRDIINKKFSAVLNTEIQKALWSCFADNNMYEIGHNIDRQFNEIYGCYKNQLFVTTSDFNISISQRLGTPFYFALYFTLLFTIPGIPLVVCGDETGKSQPPLCPQEWVNYITKSEYESTSSGWCSKQLLLIIDKLLSIRSVNSDIFANGVFKMHYLDHHVLIFSRYIKDGEKYLIVAINSGVENREIEINGIPSNVSLCTCLNTSKETEKRRKKVGDKLTVLIPKESALILKTY
ncbi:alpha amylase, catalytic domain-containing protein [Cryptosporidium muris RN66]|uniref:Alpha amylase, catalytic domain-containing protein n=1 Tax=Cryptosporidium muris (strain RN66) TaxID=441375 RepID=B6A9D2_CRYMR|nr:alpha amylase, catalytic domain-containing protein [Cryptosporidium muris RN66]EEA04823.1 alpha amylase, catalytic domain-containing protein [Cryptosporidium muris RN66]|eukprot:XP_002139172.1 alpha amylase, catalytic domain-containing protein [Cryptosporidium muris RN66]